MDQPKSLDHDLVRSCHDWTQKPGSLKTYQSSQNKFQKQQMPKKEKSKPILNSQRSVIPTGSKLIKKTNKCKSATDIEINKQEDIENQDIDTTNCVGGRGLLKYLPSFNFLGFQRHSGDRLQRNDDQVPSSKIHDSKMCKVTISQQDWIAGDYLEDNRKQKPSSNVSIDSKSSTTSCKKRNCSVNYDKMVHREKSNSTKRTCLKPSRSMSTPVDEFTSRKNELSVRFQSENQENLLQSGGLKENPMIHHKEITTCSHSKTNGISISPTLSNGSSVDVFKSTEQEPKPKQITETIKNTQIPKATSKCRISSSKTSYDQKSIERRKQAEQIHIDRLNKLKLKKLEELKAENSNFGNDPKPSKPQTVKRTKCKQSKIDSSKCQNEHQEKIEDGNKDIETTPDILKPIQTGPKDEFTLCPTTNNEQDTSLDPLQPTIPTTAPDVISAKNNEGSFKNSKPTGTGDNFTHQSFVSDSGQVKIYIEQVNVKRLTDQQLPINADKKVKSTACSNQWSRRVDHSRDNSSRDGGDKQESLSEYSSGQQKNAVPINNSCKASWNARETPSCTTKNVTPVDDLGLPIEERNELVDVVTKMLRRHHTDMPNPVLVSGTGEPCGVDEIVDEVTRMLSAGRPCGADEVMDHVTKMLRRNHTDISDPELMSATGRSYGADILRDPKIIGNKPLPKKAMDKKQTKARALNTLNKLQRRVDDCGGDSKVEQVGMESGYAKSPDGREIVFSVMCDEDGCVEEIVDKQEVVKNILESSDQSNDETSKKKNTFGIKEMTRDVDKGVKTPDSKTRAPNKNNDSGHKCIQKLGESTLHEKHVHRKGSHSKTRDNDICIENPKLAPVESKDKSDIVYAKTEKPKGGKSKKTNDNIPTEDLKEYIAFDDRKISKKELFGLRKGSKSKNKEVEQQIEGLDCEKTVTEKTSSLSTKRLVNHKKTPQRVSDSEHYSNDDIFEARGARFNSTRSKKVVKSEGGERNPDDVYSTDIDSFCTNSDARSLVDGFDKSNDCHADTFSLIGQSVGGAIGGLMGMVGDTLLDVISEDPNEHEARIDEIIGIAGSPKQTKKDIPTLEEFSQEAGTFFGDALGKVMKTASKTAQDNYPQMEDIAKKTIRTMSSVVQNQIENVVTAVGESVSSFGSSDSYSDIDDHDSFEDSEGYSSLSRSDIQQRVNRIRSMSDHVLVRMDSSFKQTVDKNNKSCEKELPTDSSLVIKSNSVIDNISQSKCDMECSKNENQKKGLFGIRNKISDTYDKFKRVYMSPPRAVEDKDIDIQAKKHHIEMSMDKVQISPLEQISPMEKQIRRCITIAKNLGTGDVPCSDSDQSLGKGSESKTQKRPDQVKLCKYINSTTDLLNGDIVYSKKEYIENDDPLQSKLDICINLAKKLVTGNDDQPRGEGRRCTGCVRNDNCPSSKTKSFISADSSTYDDPESSQLSISVSVSDVLSSKREINHQPTSETSFTKALQQPKSSKLESTKTKNESSEHEKQWSDGHLCHLSKESGDFGCSAITECHQGDGSVLKQKHINAGLKNDQVDEVKPFVRYEKSVHPVKSISTGLASSSTSVVNVTESHGYLPERSKSMIDHFTENVNDMMSYNADGYPKKELFGFRRKLTDTIRDAKNWLVRDKAHDVAKTKEDEDEDEGDNDDDTDDNEEEILDSIGEDTE